MQKCAVPYHQWGTGFEPEVIAQIERACQIPVAIAGALMPDAHVGYGLPIGGVLATDNAVIPYAVGVDIACRMKMTVLDLPLNTLTHRKDWLIKAIESETRFGIGASFKQRRNHKVMDENWSISPVTRQEKDSAWSQLGTSGSGNHFVEFGVFTSIDPSVGLAVGDYLALLSHSGSRHVGSKVCDFYSKLATKQHPELPGELKKLAWLSLDSHAGQEYWQAMELMGRYAAANHELIHRHLVDYLGAKIIFDLENHHNFAWKERHFGRSVIVHRKGATPAFKGAFGIIPGSMASPGYIVRGLGAAKSLNSASHGAGRRMSRQQAKKTLSWVSAQEVLNKQGVTVISAGLDEMPMVYKDIQVVMDAQKDLVDILGCFSPRLVKMAKDGERAED